MVRVACRAPPRGIAFSRLKPLPRHTVPDRYLAPFWLATAALIVSMAGCGDDPIQPDALARFAEADAVMRSATALPSLSELAAGVSSASPAQRATLTRAQELWSAGSRPEQPRGLAQRRVASGYAAPVLTDLVGAEEWPGIRARVDDWLGTAEQMTSHLVLPSVEERLRAARRHLGRGDDATSPDLRVYYLLLSMAELVETTPGFVARGMVDEAGRAVGRAEAALDGARRDGMLERARRLADWSARAIDEGDYLRAIQRAYYAIQLVESR
jgi:hypothetical protein